MSSLSHLPQLTHFKWAILKLIINKAGLLTFHEFLIPGMKITFNRSKP